VIALPALLLVVGLLGLAIGSFLNVVIYRVPRGESIVRPPSHCPSCGALIKPWHDVPVLGWLILRGRCAGCGAPINVRYPLVELGTGALFVLVTWRLDQLDQRAIVPAWLYFTAVGIALAAIDLETRRLPTPIILPSYAVLAALLGLAALVQPDGWALLRAALGALALFAFFFALVFIYPAGMGFGDVRLAGLLGAVLGYLGWATWAIGAFAGFLLGALVGVALLAARRAGRKTAVPFGPSMIAGALLALFVAEPFAHWYAGLMGF
jgi:leader peptidase (prepilin peptidase)/N-methyltransferase